MHKKILVLIIPFLSLFSINNINAISQADSTLVYNKGIGGNNTGNLLSRLDSDVLALHPDLVILMVGTNDLLNSKKMISYQEYTSNLNQIVHSIKLQGVQVVLMSSPPVDSTYLFLRHDKSMYSDSPNAIMDSASHIVKKVALDNDALYINIFDTFNSMGIPSHNEDLFIRNERNSNIKDGVHPTTLGYHLLANIVYQYLKENDLLSKSKKIICFGDSITKGAGSSKEKNYPSYLERRINSNG